MESLCFALSQALQRQGEILQEMLAATRAHNQSLRQNDVVALQKIIGQEEEITKRLKEEDRKRKKAHTALANKFDLTGETSLSQLLPRLPALHRARLAHLATELKNTAGEIAGLVELNGILTRQALQFNEMLLKLLQPVHNSTYQPDGKSALEVGRPSLINKTV
jgi:flagellar biosynthesis/type III secretory pathway chaperone